MVFVRNTKMLTLKTLPFLHHPHSLKKLFSSSKTPLALRPIYGSTPPPRTFSITPMASQTVEHVVLFAADPAADPSKTESMVSNLRSLSSLDQVLHLTVGPLFKNRSTYKFTHLLHSRYRTKSDLADYSAHPSHLKVVKESVLPISDDIMAVDWVADLGDGPIVPLPGSVLRLTLLKPKEGAGAEEKAKIVRIIAGIKDLFPGLIDQISFGENFSPARAKGFELGVISIFPGVKEMEALDSEVEKVEREKEKVRHLLEGIIVLDFVIPSPSPSSANL